MLDLVRVVTEEEVRTVRCVLDHVPPAQPETVAQAEIQTIGGIQCRIEVARVAAGRVGRAEWAGSDGQLIADWTNRSMRYTDGASRSEEWSTPQSPTVLTTLREFVRALQQKTPMPIAGEDGCRAVEIAEACYRSAEAGGKPVTLPLPASCRIG